MSHRAHDVTIIGGGIVGLATGMAIVEKHPQIRLAILEKESDVAAHQTGHNSGVIHSGIYYKPGSLKARLCVEGVRRMEAFCERHQIHFDRIGKVIVATDQSELPALEELYRRGTENGVPGLRKIGSDELQEIEPHVRGIAGIHSPNTGIVDYKEVCRAMADDLKSQGAEVQTGSRLHAIKRQSGGLILETSRGEVQTRYLINCAGLYSDAVARMMGVVPDCQIIPFRGEYYFIKPERHDLVHGLIYPVPDPTMPFLGVHFTRTVHGEVEAGPNAVLAFAREGYTKGRVRLDELFETLTYSGFIKMASKYWRVGMYEMYRSFSKAEFVRAMQKMLPAVQEGDVFPGGAGVRAQAVARDGKLVDDFAIMQTAEAIHVLNAPSPAATASLAIGNHIANLATEAFGLPACERAGA